MWNGEKRDNFDIYVKHISSGALLRLTSDPAPEGGPAWSPDGNRIAFVRSPPDAQAIYLTAPLGGQARKLADYSPTSQNLRSLSWSPDGQWLAVAELEPDGTNGIFLISVAQGERRKLVSNPVVAGRYGRPTFSPDGRALAFVFSNGVDMGGIRLIEIGSDLMPKGPARTLTTEVGMINGIAWAPDGRSLVYGALYQGRFYLWRTSVAGSAQPERVELAGEGAIYPAISRVGNKLAYTLSRSATGTDVWRIEAGVAPKPLVSSTRDEGDARFSPDGRKIAFVADRAGRGGEVWISDAEGMNPIQLTEGVNRFRGSPRWSPDGRWIAFDGQSEDGRWDIFVIDAAGGQPRRLTPYPTDEHVPSWSRDGKWIYCTSNQTGRFEVWRIPFAGGEGVRLTDNGGYVPFESWDGKSLYYAKYGVEGLFVRSLSGGPEQKLLESVWQSSYFPVEDGIYYLARAPMGGPNIFELRLLDLASANSRVVSRFAAGSPYALSVSPDRKSFLFSGREPGSVGYDLMLIENFR
jgi:eukaryotic-like serine/threonine-protein kinase